MPVHSKQPSGVKINRSTQRATHQNTQSTCNLSDEAHRSAETSNDQAQQISTFMDLKFIIVIQQPSFTVSLAFKIEELYSTDISPFVLQPLFKIHSTYQNLSCCSHLSGENQIS